MLAPGRADLGGSCRHQVTRRVHASMETGSIRQVTHCCLWGHVTLGHDCKNRLRTLCEMWSG